MNFLGRKMHYLANYNHDFPRLAKQSGFFFQVYRGKVNWSEIECLDLDEITEKRNFELLEQNLLNVINCNLERDYDLKILDQNFVKLFRLAQLGIDYLSYCELYLDRCVVVLQEQLMSIQEEIGSLKNENMGKSAEIKKTKIKKKINNYQCEKCEKVFISDIYLKFHDKRRHSNLLTPKNQEDCSKKTFSVGQQTESKEKLSVSIQTVLNETNNVKQKNEEIHKIKKGHNKKIKRLEKNLNDLKMRLQKAEKALQETRETSCNSASFGFPTSLHYYPHLQFIPSCFPPPRVIDEAIPMYSKSLPNNRSLVSDSVFIEDRKGSSRKNPPISDNTLTNECNGNEVGKNVEDKKLDSVNNKENIDPQEATNEAKPLPPPRRTKNKSQNIFGTEENLIMKRYDELGNGVHSVTDIVPFRSRSVDVTAVKGRSEANIHSENFEEIITKKINSSESLSISWEKPDELKSFLRKVVGRTPKLPKLRKNLKNLKKPLTSLYDSVPLRGKDLMKMENKLKSAKSVLVDGVNNQLKELGVDPEWEGIPKKTMKEKLKGLTHRRKLLSKENPLYTSVRHSVEEKIFEKLKNNLFIRNTLPKKSCSQETADEIIPMAQNPRHESQVSENIEIRDCAIMYDTDVDSWLKTSEFEKNQKKQASLLCSSPKKQKGSDSGSEESALNLGEKKFDISMFQIKTGSMENIGEKSKKDVTRVKEANEGLTTSDFEDNISIHSDEFFKTINVPIHDKSAISKLNKR